MMHKISKYPAIAAVLLITVFLACANALPGQGVHPVTGRRIAPVMGVAGADWLDRENRAREEQPEKAIAQLNLRPGMFIGDVGAGTGFYSLRMARKILPGGIVYAVDIQQGMVNRLTANAAAQKITNIVSILSTESDPCLPIGKLDLVFLADVYHEFSQPQRMLDRIRDSLGPAGKLVLLEFRKEDPSVPIRPEHKMSVDEVKAEVVPEGYAFEKVVDTMPWQHIIVFRKSVQ